MRKSVNNIITNIITKVYIENNKYYVIFYSNINYNYYTVLYINNLNFYDKTCNIIKIETCTKSNLLLYTCEVQGIDLPYDIRNCINANITVKPFGFRMKPGFSATDAEYPYIDTNGWKIVNDGKMYNADNLDNGYF